jgi:hypothetical protein
MTSVKQSPAPVNPAPEAPAKKQRKKPARFVCVVRPVLDDLPAIVRIQVGKKADLYAVYPIVCQIGGSGYTVEKLDPASQEPVEVYHVRIDGATRACDCKGHARHQHCKHADGLAKLIELKRI